MTTPNAENYSMVERRVGDLWVDPNVQRSLRKARVTTMAAKFRPEALGVITTSYRSMKRVHIIDGQHRYRAAEAARYTGPIQTMEYRGLTIPQEAALFRLLNETEKVSKIDEFLVACVAQDPDALRLAGFLADNGWAVGIKGTQGRLSAISSLERVYKMNPDAAAATLAVITKAYGHQPAAVQGSLIEGLGRVLARYGTNVNLNRMADKLSAVPGGPNGLVGNARGQSFTRTGTLATQVARVIVNDIYNKQLKGNALAPWT